MRISNLHASLALQDVECYGVKWKLVNNVDAMYCAIPGRHWPCVMFRILSCLHSSIYGKRTIAPPPLATFAHDPGQSPPIRNWGGAFIRGSVCPGGGANVRKGAFVQGGECPTLSMFTDIVAHLGMNMYAATIPACAKKPASCRAIYLA